MKRLNISVTEHTHKLLKVMAAMSDATIGEVVDDMAAQTYEARAKDLESLQSAKSAQGNQGKKAKRAKKNE